MGNAVENLTKNDDHFHLFKFPFFQIILLPVDRFHA